MDNENRSGGADPMDASSSPQPPDAWPTATGTLVQRSGNCDTTAVERLGTGGSTTVLTRHVLQGVANNTIAATRSTGCPETSSDLIAVDLAGTDLFNLVPAVGDAFGVESVHGLAEVYP